MKLYRYLSANGPRVGVGFASQLLDTADLFERAGQRPPDVLLQGDLKSICAAPDVVIVFLAEYLKQDSIPANNGVTAIPLESARLLPPLPNPDKFICIGLNYQDHCDEQHKSPPSRPMLFGKYNNAIVGHDDPVVHSPITQQLDYEGELGVIIGLGGKGIKQEQALQHVFGYTIINDITARDAQKSDGQFLRAKSQDTFAPMGPCVVTTHEIPEPGKLKIRTLVNGEIMQDSNTGNMIFGVPELIEFISEGITLSPGDIISTGTPAGVGIHRDPQVLLKAGDRVEVEIEGIGRLRNSIVAP